MHRIDSATARADANGNGKTGFSDNGDLPNQDATYFTPDWANTLQEEIANVIEEFGITLDKSDNGQLLTALVQQFAKKQTLEQTIIDYDQVFLDLTERLEELENRTYEDTQIGEHVWFEQHFDTPAQVATYKGYGTWERALQGRVAVGFSDIPDDKVEFRTHGAEYGESEHTLIIDEIPSHSHKYTIALESSGAGGGIDTGTAAAGELGDNIKNTGGGQPHNNMPPAKTLDCWKRVS